MKRKPHDTFSRSAMKFLCTVLGMILALMLGATAIFQHTLKTLDHTDPLPLRREGLLTALTDSVRTQLRFVNSDEKLIGGTGSGIINILLVGQDRRENEAQARSDSMILCTFHKESGKLTMTSFLRDLYVPIPGYHDNRINAAYSEGGIQLLSDTLESNFQLHIDGCVEVDFSQFSQIIDQLGGVKIELREDEANVINRETGSNLTEGLQTLDGTQALAYSRIRNLDWDGDFSRTERQRKVMSALLSSYRNTDFKELVTLINTLLPMISTDLNQAQILMLVLDILPHLSDLETASQRIPADGTFSDQTIDGMSVLVPDMEANRRILQETLLSQ